MGVKSDKWFRERCTGDAPMIEPYVPNLVREVAGCKVISYGQSSYGYDIRCGNEFKVFTNVNCAEVDPKGLKETAFTTFTREDGEYILIPPNSFVLASSVEYFRIPRDVIGVCFGKSTMARAGLIVPITPLEPGWEGHLTIEVSNTTPLPARLYAGEGVSQLVFIGADFELRTADTHHPVAGMRGGSIEGVVELLRETCETSYADRGGKYQGQRGITLPKA